MKLFILLPLLLACRLASADCPTALPLKGVVSVETCQSSSENCVTADAALHAYMSARKDNSPELLVIGLHGSPWHLYGPDFHILEIAELAAMVKQQGGKIKRVVLLSSWSGVAPDRHGKSLAKKLSTALGGMPVTGKDGFVWFSKSGAVHTTKQAFTVTKNGPYMVANGEKVMASLVAGWPVGLENEFAEKREAAGLMRAGVGADIYLLCPERALRVYEASAALSDPIAAYNAAIMRLERAQPGDAEAAISLLKQSAASGDQKARVKLDSLSAKVAVSK